AWQTTQILVFSRWGEFSPTEKPMGMLHIGLVSGEEPKRGQATFPTGKVACPLFGAVFVDDSLVLNAGIKTCRIRTEPADVHVGPVDCASNFVSCLFVSVERSHFH